MCLLRSCSRRTVFGMLTRFGNAEQALPHLSDPTIPSVESLVLECKEQQINSVGYFDDSFPPLLREIPDPPLLLYFRGDLNVAKARAVAIVGSRRCTAAGVNIAEHLAEELTGSGIGVVVVSPGESTPQRIAAPCVGVKNLAVKPLPCSVAVSAASIPD